MTIRLRLTLLYSSLLIATILVFGGAVYGVLDRTLRTQLDNDLEQVINDTESDIRDSITEDGEVAFFAPLPVDTFQSETYFVQLWLVDEELPVNLSRSLGTYNQPLDRDALNGKHNGYSTVTIDENRLRVQTRSIGIDGETVAFIQVAASLKPVTDATDRLLGIMGGLTLMLIIVSAVLGYFMALNVLKDITRINETAAAIVAAADLKRRVPHTGKHDELGALTATINDMLERLEKLFNTQQRFVSDVSHELRTPITAIQGHVEIMQRYGYEKDSMDAVARSTDRMVQLVEDLMMLANADIGRIAPTRSQVEMDTLILNVYKKSKSLAESRGVRLSLGHIDPVMLEADVNLLNQLLHHLVHNALCYTKEDGTVVLSVEQKETSVEVSVADTGIGIAEKDLLLIFDRFYRVDTSRTRPGGGSGLGLSIAMWIARAHGGDLVVKSTVGKGSTFTLQLPCTPPSSQ